MRDKMLEGFLRRQLEEGMALAGASDRLELLPERENPPQRYVAVFHCRGLVRNAGGEIHEGEQFSVGIWFPEDYLRRANPFEVLSWLGPHNVYHPNIGSPLICVGSVPPGTALTDLLYQVYEVITYNRVTMREDDALNKDACPWARHNQHRFPIDDRPLKRRTRELRVELSCDGASEAEGVTA